MFEAMKSYGGFLLGLDWHLDRLERSSARIGIPLPPRNKIREWALSVGREGGDGVVRIIITRGSAIPDFDDPGRCVVMHHQMPEIQEVLTLRPTVAPWHSAGVDWALAGAKTISYAPNMAASRLAKEDGFDDALLLSKEQVILEGPTFSVGWVVGDCFETPSLDLLILDSITRRYVLELVDDAGLTLREGRFPLDRLDDAEEVVAMSTGHEIRVVSAVGDRNWALGPVAENLKERFRERVERARVEEPQ